VEAARIARRACEAYASDSAPRFVAGALGPTPRTASISPDVNDPGARNVSFDELVQAYGEQARGLLDGAVDLLLIETIFDTLNAKAAIFAIEQEFERRGARVPLIISGTVTDASGRLLSGQTVEAFWNSVRHARPLAVGNQLCAGRGADAPVHRGAVGQGGRVRQRLPERWPAQSMSDTGFDETPDVTLEPAGRVRTQRIREPGRWLLRHHARAHPRCRAGGVGPCAAQGGGDRVAVAAGRSGAAEHRTRDAVRQRRRAQPT